MLTPPTFYRHRSRTPSQKKRPFVRLSVERLEDRLAPATVPFLGASNDWYDEANWPANIAPGPNDDVVLSNASELSVVNLNINASGIQVKSLAVNAGFTVTIDGSLSVDSLYFWDGTINGGGALNVANQFAWQGGVMGGSGTTTLATGASASIMQGAGNPGTASLAGARIYVNHGTTTAYGAWSIASTITIENRGSLTFNGDEIFGSFTHDASTPIQNFGILTYDNCNVTFAGPLTINNTVRIVNGVVGKQTTVTDNVTMGNLYLDANLNGAGHLTVSNIWTWKSGKLSTSAGKIIVPATGRFELPFGTDRLLADRKLDIRGAHGWEVHDPSWPLGNYPAYQDLQIMSVADNPFPEWDGTFDNTGIRPTSGPISAAPFNPTAAAGAIYRAMFGGMTGAGTDEEALCTALEGARSAADVSALVMAYSRQYPGRNLHDDFVSELSGDDYKRAHALYNSDWNRYVAVSMHEAMYALTYWSIPVDQMVRLAQDSRTTGSQVITKYAAEYVGQVLVTDLSNRLLAPDYDRVNALLTGDAASADAAAIRNQVLANEAAWTGPDVNPFVEILRNRTPAQIEIIQQRYSEMYGNNVPTAMITDMYNGLSVDEQALLGNLMMGDRIGAAVRILHAAMDGVGTREAVVWNTLTGLFADERAMVAQRYRQTYGTTLLADINGEFSNGPINGLELDKTQKLFRHGGLTLAERFYYATMGWGTDDPAIQSALAELRALPPGQLAQVRQEYAGIAGGETLDDALYGDLNGRDWFRAQQALLTPPTDPKERLIFDANRIIAEYNHEVDGWTNAINNGVQWTFNNHGASLDAAVGRLQAARDAFDADRNDQAKETALRNAIADVEQHLQTFQDAREATTEVFTNVLATAAGIGVVVLSGGTATPIVVAIAAGAGGATQALTRMGLSGSFDWEQLPTDFAIGAVNGATSAFSFPAATRQAIANGTAQVGVLRQVAGSSFAGGAASGGLSAALNEETWSRGFATGVVNVAQAAGVAGFAGTALPGVVGAGALLMRRVPLNALFRRLSGQGTTDLVFDSSLWNQVRAAFAAGQTIEQVLQTLPQISEQIDVLAGRIATLTSDSTEAQVRDALRAVMNQSLPSAQRTLFEEIAVQVWQTNRNALSSVTRQAVAGVFEGAINHQTQAIDSLARRLAANGISHATAAEAAQSLAQRLGTLQDADDIGIRQALQEVLGANQTITADMIGAIRAWRATAQRVAAVLDPQLDNNMMSALANSADGHHAAAVAYANSHMADGLSINQHTVSEFLRRYTQADLDNLVATYGIRVINEVSMPEIDAIALRLQAAFRNSNPMRVLGDGDARVAATAFLRGEKLATTDERFFKRCLDLGLDVDFVGGGPVAVRCAAYAPRLVTIPPG